MMTHTEDRTVLITGGATRIGKHIALGLAKDGWNVAVHYNESESEAVDLLQSLKNMGVKSVAVKANLAHEDSTINLIATIRKELGNIHGLVNNASMFSFDRPEQFDRSNLEKHMAVNLYAPLRLTSEFAKQISPLGKSCLRNYLKKIASIHLKFQYNKVYWVNLYLIRIYLRNEMLFFYAFLLQNLLLLYQP